MGHNSGEEVETKTMLEQLREKGNTHTMERYELY
jgi:hypothetical protein